MRRFAGEHERHLDIAAKIKRYPGGDAPPAPIVVGSHFKPSARQRLALDGGCRSARTFAIDNMMTQIDRRKEASR
jgi:hypothetical protein